jgi:hypothetical protein
MPEDRKSIGRRSGAPTILLTNTSRFATAARMAIVGASPPT